MTTETIHSRSFRTLRVSLTNACNFGCIYCVNGEDKGGMNTAGNQPALPYTKIASIVLRLNDVLPLRDVRLTGGEPMLYRHLLPFLSVLQKGGIRNLKMTTNGFFLKQQAASLAAAGLHSVNVSLDAVEPEVFFRIARRNLLPDVTAGIDAALKAGLSVKVNSVIMRGINEQQILPLLDFAMTRGIELRFLELMRMGHFYSHHFDQYFFSMEEIHAVIQSKYSARPLERNASATALRWQLADGYTYGIIANESRPFCADCDRLRLDSFGTIFGCLSDERSESVLAWLNDDAALHACLQRALLHKQPLRFTGSPLKMLAIGG